MNQDQKKTSPERVRDALQKMTANRLAEARGYAQALADMNAIVGQDEK